MTRFIVVRHGQTHWNVEARIQGQGDSDLTDEGVAQAEAIGARLAGEPIDVVVASDLGRALETARRIVKRTGHAIATDARLRERNFGRGEGMTYEEVDRAYPGAFARVRDVDPDFVVPGGESRRQFHERVCTAFDAIAAEHAGKTVLVVTHGGVLATFYRHIHAIDLGVAHPIAIVNASYNVLRHDAGRWSIETWSDSAHLAGAEPFEEA
ncbi:MAG TPA: histidine phosphatase family protein [Usitatibacter sp.]|jgi:probable phosphoglycerate mutase|nr:histidine phosphatase family protein [Usitatibacter sp.]